MKIILVRHGDSKGDKLTPVGARQARRVVRELRYENISKIFCSPTARTTATAKIIARKLGVHNILEDVRLTERNTDKGLLSEAERMEYDANYLSAEYSSTVPEGCKDFLERVHAFLDDVIGKYGDSENECVLVVGHSSLSYAMIAYFYGVTSGKVAWTRLGNCSKLCFESVYNMVEDT